MERLESIAGILELDLLDILEFDHERIMGNTSSFPVKEHIHISFLEKERQLYEERIDHLENEISFLRKLLTKNVRE